MFVSLLSFVGPAVVLTVILCVPFRYPAGGAFNKARANEKNNLDDILVVFLEPYERAAEKQQFIRENLLPRVKVYRWVGRLDTGYRFEPALDETVSRLAQRLRDLRKRLKDGPLHPERHRTPTQIEIPPFPKPLSILKRPAARKPSQIKNASSYAARLKRMPQPGGLAGRAKRKKLAQTADAGTRRKGGDNATKKRKGSEPTNTLCTPKRKKQHGTDTTSNSDSTEVGTPPVGDRLITLTPDGNLAWNDGRIFSYCRNPPKEEEEKIPTLTMFPKGEAFNELRASERHDIDQWLIDKFLVPYEETPHKVKFIKQKIISSMNVLLWDGTPNDGGPVVPRRNELVGRMQERLNELVLEKQRAAAFFV